MRDASEEYLRLVLIEAQGRRFCFNHFTLDRGMPMVDYAKLIADLKLIKQLKKSQGRDDVPASDIDKLVAMVNDAADIAAPLLERIPQTFKQYTDHNIGHCINLIDLMGRFIPRKTVENLNGLELAVLILSALLHDFGMFVTDREKSEALRSKGYEAFLASHHDRATAILEARARGDHERARVIEDALLAEYFRRMHPERARVNVQKNLEGKLFFRDVDISPYVLDVCESHAWGVYESNDPLRPDKAVSRLSTNRAVYGIPLNLQYIACCLRLADIMDFDRSRTPLVVFQNIDFTEDKSWEEWNKHLQVKGWKINERDVMFRTECTHPAFYVAVMEFLEWVDLELNYCRRLIVKDAPKEIAERYMLHLPPIVDRSEIEMEDKNYLAGVFRFQLEYERIMKLLMDKSLYPDPSLFLRELLQNSLDACRYREAQAKDVGFGEFYTPRISVWDFSDDPERPRIIFQDNGIGMSRKIVEEYFMRVGRSYYRSPEFDAERARLKEKHIELEATSQFGIGILSCFMVADRFEVETYRVGSNPLHITIEGPTKYFIIKVLNEPPRTDFPTRPDSDLEDCPPAHSGTRITVHLRPDAKPKVFETLETFAVNVDYDINVYGMGDTEQRTISRRRWEPERQPWNETLPASIKLSGYKPVEDDEKENLLKNVQEVLVPSVLNFNAYEFSRHLRGTAWFWLLQGGEGVCPQRGYLQVTAQGLSLKGLPKVIRGLSEEINSDEPAKSKRLLKLLEANLSDDTGLQVNSAEYQRVMTLFGKVRKREAINFIKMWNSVPLEDRLLAYESLKVFKEDGVFWYSIEGMSKELLHGRHEWVGQPVDFGNNVQLNLAPRMVALHGILLPAGFLSWNPMSGSSSKLEMLKIPGGVQLDIHGVEAPTPAASRLFIDKLESKKVLLPFARVVLRHAFELATRKTGEPGWDEWSHQLLNQMSETPFWNEAVREEFDLLESHLKYLVSIEEKDVYLSGHEVIQKFGRWAPLGGGRYYEDENEQKNGVTAYNSGNTLLLATKTLRQSGDGLWEIDMESKLPFQEENVEPLRQILFTYLWSQVK